MSNISALLPTIQLASTDAGQASNSANMLVQIGLIVGMIVLMYFILIRPQRKQQKKAEQMRKDIQVGDEIITIGGIVGKVVSVKEDSLIIETGADRDKLRIKKWAIQTNQTEHTDA